MIGLTPPEPVPIKHLPSLGELLLWIYGSRSQQKGAFSKEAKTPDLNLLREAIGSENAHC